MILGFTAANNFRSLRLLELSLLEDALNIDFKHRVNRKWNTKESNKTYIGVAMCFPRELQFCIFTVARYIGFVAF